jgi:hypothetical protein
MKNFVFLLPAISILLMVSCKPSVKEAIAYNESIVSHHEDIDKKIAYLIDTYDDYVPAEMDSAYTTALKAAQDGIDFANKLEPFGGDDSYKKGAIALFEVYKSVIEVEHAKIIALLKLPPEKYQQEQIDEFDQLKDSAEKKILDEINKIGAIQEQFAMEFNFKIDEEKKE